MLRTIPLLFTLILLSGCWAKTFVEPDPHLGPPGGGQYPSAYLKGWSDGCQTGMASSADNIYQYRRLFQQDWMMAQDNVYHNGWRDAYDYCRKYYLHKNHEDLRNGTLQMS